MYVHQAPFRRQSYHGKSDSDGGSQGDGHAMYWLGHIEM